MMGKRGRPNVPVEEKLSVLMSLRLTRSQYNLLLDLGGRVGEGPSDILRAFIDTIKSEEVE